MTNLTNSVHVAPSPRRLLPALLVAGAVALGLPAVAHSAETGAVKLQYSKAALKTEDGARAFYAKLQQAARRACGDADDPSLHAIMAVRECRERAVTEATESIDSRMLAAVHQSETGATRVAGAGTTRTSR